MRSQLEFQAKVIPMDAPDPTGSLPPIALFNEDGTPFTGGGGGGAAGGGGAVLLGRSEHPGTQIGTNVVANVWGSAPTPDLVEFTLTERMLVEIKAAAGIAKPGLGNSEVALFLDTVQASASRQDGSGEPIRSVMHSAGSGQPEWTLPYPAAPKSVGSGWTWLLEAGVHQAELCYKQSGGDAGPTMGDRLLIVLGTSLA